MMKRRGTLLGFASVLLLTLTVYAGEGINLEGIKCVMNPKGAAKADKSVDYKGGKVFFCCANCPKAFATKVKTDKTVAAKANAQLVATKQAKQTKCPITGRPCKASTAIEVAGAKVAFCCNNCKAKAAGLKGDEQLLLVLSDKAFDKAGFKVKKEDKE